MTTTFALESISFVTMLPSLVVAAARAPRVVYIYAGDLNQNSYINGTTTTQDDVRRRTTTYVGVRRDVRRRSSTYDEIFSVGKTCPVRVFRLVCLIRFVWADNNFGPTTRNIQR